MYAYVLAVAFRRSSVDAVSISVQAALGTLRNTTAAQALELRRLAKAFDLLRQET